MNNDFLFCFFWGSNKYNNVKLIPIISLYFHPETDIVNICERSAKKTKRNAYLMSPGYPDRYPGSVECACNITTEIDQRILLTFADFDLEWSENCERDILQVRTYYFQWRKIYDNKLHGCKFCGGIHIP